MPRYFDTWENAADVARDFGVNPALVPDAEILIASYGYEDYRGNAFVLGRRADGTLWEVSGGHCSCFDLEGQWEPEDTTLAALTMRAPSVWGAQALEVAFILAKLRQEGGVVM